MSTKAKNKLIFSTLSLLIICLATYFSSDIEEIYNKIMNVEIKSYNINEIPSYNGSKYVFINNNEPEFKESDYTISAFEKYSNLDILKRCGVAFANIGIELMPTEERGPIGMIKPSGWQIAKYDDIEGKYLYNRCHLIAYQLTGENANPKNLITCTRSMNKEGMLPFENRVASYIKKTNNHVLYRVSPVFEGDNLLVNGVQMEAKSVEDDGKGISFNIFVYNVQDGIEINYKNGDNKKA